MKNYINIFISSKRPNFPFYWKQLNFIAFNFYNNIKIRTIPVIIKYLETIKSKIYIFIEIFNKFNNSLIKKIGYSIFDIQEAFIISSLILIATKLLIYIFFSYLLHPLLSISLYLITTIISLKKGLLFKFRENLIVPFLEKSLNFNFYRHNVYDVINDLDFRYRYKQGILGTVQFYIVYFYYKINQNIYFIFIFLRLIMNLFPISFIILQQIIFYFFIINKQFILMFILLLIFHFSRIFYYLSGYKFIFVC